MNIALKSIGVDTSSSSELRKVLEPSIELDDDNPPAYEIKFVYENVKYEFLIHAQSGKILKLKKKL